MPTRVTQMVLLGCAVLAACRPAPTPTPNPVTIRIAGSDSMELLARGLADAYHQLHPNVTIELETRNSSAGLRLLSQGAVDLALISRTPRATELRNPRAHALELTRDAIVPVVHASNKLPNVSREQLARIFSGEILAWSELTPGASGSPDDTIQVVSREEGSGSRAVFEQLVMGDRRVTRAAIIGSGEQAVLDYVAAHPNAIGYVGFARWQNDGRTTALSIDGVSASPETVESGAFPLMRSLYLVVPDAANAEIEALVDFAVRYAKRTHFAPAH